MARVSELKNLMDDGWEIIIKGKSRDELNKITELVNNMDVKGITKYPYYKKEPQRESMDSPKIVKPQGMLYVLKDESMLELAKQIVNAVEYSIEIPKGLESLKFDIKQETINRLHELTDYLRTYADWRE